MEFNAKELAQATKDYGRASLIGRGGFGVVYKGYLRYCDAAIKVLTKVRLFSFSLECNPKSEW